MFVAQDVLFAERIVELINIYGSSFIHKNIIHLLFLIFKRMGEISSFRPKRHNRFQIMLDRDKRRLY